MLMLSINSTTAFAQNNAAPDETTTPAYTLLDLSIGGNIKVSGQLMSLKLSATNITDKKYIDHLSTLKEVNLFQSRKKYIFSMKIPFGLNLKIITYCFINQGYLQLTQT